MEAAGPRHQPSEQAPLSSLGPTGTEARKDVEQMGNEETLMED